MYRLRLKLQANNSVIIAVASSFLGGMFINTVSDPQISKSVYQVLENVFSTNQRPLNYLSWLALIALIFYPFIKTIVAIHSKHRGIETLFKNLLLDRISPSIQSFSKGKIAWDTSLTIQQVPDLTKGWKLQDIEFHFQDEKYVFTDKWKNGYDEYFENNYETERFFDDGKKYMITVNPTNFTDSPSLKLNLVYCRYSQVQFVRKFISRIKHEKNEFIENLFLAKSITFPHALSLHLLIVTSDNKILLTHRDDKVSYYPNTWSASIEEQFHEHDFIDRNTSPLQKCVERLFIEELGLLNTNYDINDLKTFSIFLESDILNIGMASRIKLKIDSSSLSTIIDNIPKMDAEFKDYIFLNYNELLTELKYPSKKMHPSGRYRMLLALYNQYGPLELISKLMNQ